MDFTTKQIEERLNVLIGQQNDHYKVAEIIKDIFAETLNVEKEKIWSYYTWSTSKYYHQTLYFNWRGYGVVRVEYKKKKGEKHYHWYTGSSTDYTFKSFEVFFYNNVKTIFEGIENANKLATKQKENNDNLRNASKEIFKHIKEYVETLDDKNITVADVIKTIDNNKYSFDRELREEQSE